jgi:hypothetical protein
LRVVLARARMREVRRAPTFFEVFLGMQRCAITPRASPAHG